MSLAHSQQVGEAFIPAALRKGILPITTTQVSFEVSPPIIEHSEETSPLSDTWIAAVREAVKLRSSETAWFPDAQELQAQKREKKILF